MASYRFLAAGHSPPDETVPHTAASRQRGNGLWENLVRAIQQIIVFEIELGVLSFLCALSRQRKAFRQPIAKPSSPIDEVFLTPTEVSKMSPMSTEFP